MELTGKWHSPPNYKAWLSLATAYSCMILSQVHGHAILAWLQHGGNRTKFDGGSSRDSLCAAYEGAHFHPISEILHASGMLSSSAMFAVIVILLAINMRSGREQPQQYYQILLWLTLWIPPLYYIPAWIGHFAFQRDVPAVFTYATTFSGWRAGETCAWNAFLGLRTVSEPTEWAGAIVLACVELWTVVMPKIY